MFRLHGFKTQNTLKTLYVLEEVVGDFEFQFVNLGKGEQRTEEFLKMAPIGKVPVLEHDGDSLFESGAICRYAANVSNSPLYPENAMQRAKVDQWMDFFSCHLGRWFTILYYETVIKSQFNLGDPDEAAIEEAIKYANIQLKVVDSLLENSDWLANDALSVADLFAFAYIEQYRDVDFAMDAYPNVVAWFDRIDARESVARARARLA
jgi:glutathione S-transferase